MASVHHQAALDFLMRTKKDAPVAADVQSAIDKAFPGWGNNAAPMIGYNNPHHHVSLIVSRSLHDTLPLGKSGYAWDYQHGFNDVMKYLDHPAADGKSIDKWLGAAIVELKRVMAD